MPRNNLDNLAIPGGIFSESQCSKAILSDRS
jgi:hypothetical protein